MDSIEKAKDIDEYLSKLPVGKRNSLEKLRQIIKQVVPSAEEVISYGMPAFKYHGILVYFAAFKNHCSLFPGSSTLTKLKNELKPYQTSKGTLQFTIDKPLPTSLVKKIIKARKEENESRLLAKTVKKKNLRKRNQ